MHIYFLAIKFQGKKIYSLLHIKQIIICLTIYWCAPSTNTLFVFKIILHFIIIFLTPQKLYVKVWEEIRGVKLKLYVVNINMSTPCIFLKIFDDIQLKVDKVTDLLK